MGSLLAMNLVGAIQTALNLPEGTCVAIIMYNGGQRHVTQFGIQSLLKTGEGLQWSDANCIPECLQDIRMDE